MKNSKKKYSGNKVLNIFTIIFEVIFSLIVIVNTFQILWCGIGGIGHLINNGDIDDYTKTYIFDGSILENEDVPIGHRDLTNEDMYIIKEYNVSNDEIVIYYWTKIISREILYICLILVCELIRRFLANDNLKNPFTNNNIILFKKIKKFLLIAVSSILIIDLICILFTHFSINYFDDIIIWITIYALFDLMLLLITNGEKLIEKK